MLLVLVLVAMASAWYGVVRRGAARVVGLVLAALALGGALALVVARGAPLQDLLIVAGLLAALAAARAALAVHVDLPSAPPPRHPVLFFNPRSGGGKAERFALAQEAAKRGIEPIELKAGDDLEKLVRDAVERGADGLAMAGGDGSQAIVAAVAAEHGLPYACVPPARATISRSTSASTATTSSGRSTPSSTGVNDGWTSPRSTGAVFVNNVSLGLYADAVQRAGYRDAKIRTLLDTVPDVLGPDGGNQTCGGGDPAGTSTAAVPRCWSPTTATGSGVLSARYPPPHR